MQTFLMINVHGFVCFLLGLLVHRAYLFWNQRSNVRWETWINIQHVISLLLDEGKGTHCLFIFFVTMPLLFMVDPTFNKKQTGWSLVFPDFFLSLWFYRLAFRVCRITGRLVCLYCPLVVVKSHYQNVIFFYFYTKCVPPKWYEWFTKKRHI